MIHWWSHFSLGAVDHGLGIGVLKHTLPNWKNPKSEARSPKIEVEKWV
jgi:hypothetical protein